MTLDPILSIRLTADAPAPAAGTPPAVIDVPPSRNPSAVLPVNALLGRSGPTAVDADPSAADAGGAGAGADLARARFAAEGQHADPILVPPPTAAQAGLAGLAGLAALGLWRQVRRWASGLR